MSLYKLLLLLSVALDEPSIRATYTQLFISLNKSLKSSKKKITLKDSTTNTNAPNSENN